VIAADVDKSESVSAIDLVELRKLILGIYEELPENSSWRFVDAEKELNQFSPWPVPDYILIESLEEDEMNEHFTAVKVGDVNNTASANAQDINTESRSQSSLDFIVEPENGQLVFKAADNFNDVFGYQFTMKVDGKVETIIPTAIANITNQNFGVLENGIVTCSYHNVSGMSIEKGQELFRITGIKSAELVSGLVRSEAYVNTDEAKNYSILDVRFVDDNTVELVNALYQNNPNPFSEETIIEFDLAKAGAATISIFDMSGKLIKTIEDDYEAGKHQVRLKRSELKTSGVLQYQIESGEFLDSKRMIIID